MQTPTDYKGVVNLVIDFINIIIPTLFAIIFTYFVWKMIDSWVLHAGEESKRDEGKKYASIAVLVFVLGIVAWGIVGMIRRSIFGF